MLRLEIGFTPGNACHKLPQNGQEFQIMNGKLLLATCVVALSILSLGLSTGALKGPRVVFVTGDHEYSSEETMPIIAAALENRYGMRTTVLKAYPDENAEENIPGL